MNDISRASSTLDAPLRLLYTLPTEHPRALLTLSLGALLITPPVLSYRAYAGRKASAGVYTSDVAGWLRRMLFLPFFRETRSTAMYDSDPNTDRWLLPDELPCREGERPVWDSSIGPQRQVDQLPSLEMREKISAAMRACAKANPKLIQIERSPNETQSPGMVIHPRIPTLHHAARAASREVGHVHSDCEYSVHLVLAPQDCKLVIERGWGERHPIAGAIKLPKEYMFVYAPRDDTELVVVAQIMRAAVGFMTGSRAVC